MAVDVNTATRQIKEVGATNVRITPMSGQSVMEGDHQIEINQNGTWSPIVTGVKRTIAEQIVSQALNRVICG